jgi:hypothetical protein
VKVKMDRQIGSATVDVRREAGGDQDGEGGGDEAGLSDDAWIDALVGAVRRAGIG